MTLIKDLDGYALIEIGPEGEGRLKEVKFFGYHLEDMDFHKPDILHQIMHQLPKGPEKPVDVLLAAIFSYKAATYYDPFNGDYDREDRFNSEVYSIIYEY